MNLNNLKLLLIASRFKSQNHYFLEGICCLLFRCDVYITIVLSFDHVMKTNHNNRLSCKKIIEWQTMVFFLRAIVKTVKGNARVYNVISVPQIVRPFLRDAIISSKTDLRCGRKKEKRSYG